MFYVVNNLKKYKSPESTPENLKKINRIIVEFDYAVSAFHK